MNYGMRQLRRVVYFLLVVHDQLRQFQTDCLSFLQNHCSDPIETHSFESDRADLEFLSRFSREKASNIAKGCISKIFN